ncbi:MAG TPA: helix-turn-helix domain-containing protein [Acidimicrobiales bacterium]|nr:helix-turn-helix domain-containing protein [Acidimicrobiales bacterium]
MLQPHPDAHARKVEAIAAALRERVQSGQPVHIHKGGVHHFVPLPRLLLVPAGAAPPQDVDHLTEWVRHPASEHEVAARVVALVRRAGAFLVRPHVDEHGRISYRDRWSALSPIESRIAGVLCDRFCQLVDASQLRASAWPPHHSVDPPTPTAFRVHLHRLRQRVADLGLEVVTVRNEGVVLQPAPPARDAPRAEHKEHP